MDLFDLAAKITLDSSEYEKGLDNAKGKTNGFASAIGNGLKTAAKVGTAAIAAASAGVVALTKSAIDGYAEYEQLVGGVETLFKGSADIVQGYAENAYRTAGLSANEYMETVTSFSASLLQSLGGDTESAAKYADVAITDMADNANKMGSSMESIQNAYQGFAKQNYTMLDNLKLGYGGTKTEMERLITDAESLDSSFTASRDSNGQLTMSYADVVDAIHIVQDNMGITGTTAKEASETISGSVASMKSAWDNLVTGLGRDDADMDSLVTNLTDSMETAINNIAPVLERALGSIGDVITKLAPVIAEKIPGILSSVLPSILQASMTLIQAFGKFLLDNAPMLMQTALDIVMMLAQGLIDNVDELVAGAVELISQFATFLGENASMLIQAAIDIILALFDALTDPGNISTLIDAAIFLIISLAEALVTNIPELISRIPEIVMNLVNAFIENAPKLAEAGVELILMLVQGIFDAYNALINAVLEILGGIGDSLGEWGKSAMKIVKTIWNGIKAYFSTIWNGIKSIFTTALTAVKNNVSGVFNGIKSFFSNIWNGIKGIFSNSLNNIKTTVTSVVNAVKNTFSTGFNAAKNTVLGVFDAIKNGIKSKLEAAKSVVSSMIEKIKGFFNFKWSLPKIKLPHFSVSGSSNPIDWISQGVPKISVSWYKKAYDNPYLFDKQTVLPFADGFKGFGDGNGAEIVYGRDNLMRDIREAIGGAGGYTQNVYITSPKQLSPSEIARQTRNATRNMVLSMRRV